MVFFGFRGQSTGGLRSDEGIGLVFRKTASIVLPGSGCSMDGPWSTQGSFRSPTLPTCEGSFHSHHGKESEESCAGGIHRRKAVQNETGIRESKRRRALTRGLAAFDQRGLEPFSAGGWPSRHAGRVPLPSTMAPARHGPCRHWPRPQAIGHRAKRRLTRLSFYRASRRLPPRSCTP